MNHNREKSEREASGTGSGLERVNTLTTRLHRLPTLVEENKGAYVIASLVVWLFFVCLFVCLFFFFFFFFFFVSLVICFILSLDSC
jgi:hypothetical protein